MNIDRCVCYGRTFAELKEVAEATGAESVEALQEHVVFGHNCQMCHPYVRRMLQTGETAFDRVVSDDEVDAAADASEQGRG
jgi:bacterioferritin-associated ferredoxin